MKLSIWLMLAATFSIFDTSISGAAETVAPAPSKEVAIKELKAGQREVMIKYLEGLERPKPTGQSL